MGRIERGREGGAMGAGMARACVGHPCTEATVTAMCLNARRGAAYLPARAEERPKARTARSRVDFMAGAGERVTRKKSAG